MSISQGIIVLGYFFAGYPDEEIDSPDFGDSTVNPFDEVRQLIEEETGVYVARDMAKGWIASYEEAAALVDIADYAATEDDSD